MVIALNPHKEAVVLIEYRYEYLCCGKGTLEIKRSYSCQEQSFEEVAKKKSKKDQDYYHQVQLQMKLCGISYSDFVIWSNQQALHQHHF